MEPYFANSREARRQALLTERLEQRLFSLCIPHLLPLLGGNDIPQAQSMVTAHISKMKQQEPNLLSRSTEFLAQVVTERCKQLILAQQRREKEVSLLARDHLIASKPTEAELLRRSMKSEIVSRFSKLNAALVREDRSQTGTLPPHKIRMLCRQFNLESGTLDNALAACYLDSISGGAVEYEKLVAVLLQTDYSDLFGTNGSTAAAGNEKLVGRSSLRRRRDGPANTVRIHQVPVDEWSVLTKNNNAIASAYEQKKEDNIRKDTYQYGQELKNDASTRRAAAKDTRQKQIQREREEQDFKMNEYNAQQQQQQERQAQFELESWQEGQNAVRLKKNEQARLKKEEIDTAKERVRQNNAATEREYLNNLQKVADQKQRWRDSLEHNRQELIQKQVDAEQEKVQDFIRNEEYSLMLEKEHVSRTLCVVAVVWRGCWCWPCLYFGGRHSSLIFLFCFVSQVWVLWKLH